MSACLLSMLVFLLLQTINTTIIDVQYCCTKYLVLQLLYQVPGTWYYSSRTVDVVYHPR